MSILYRKLDENQYFVRKTFRRFFWPAVFSSVWLAIAGVVDSVFVGHAIGAAGLSAISLGMPVYLFYNILWQRGVNGRETGFSLPSPAS